MIDYGFGFINPVPEMSREPRRLYDTFHAVLRPWHYGTDIYGPLGSPVVAAADGPVRIARPWDGKADNGNTIDILHKATPGWFNTRYLHLDEIHVRVGEVVRQGQVIGLLGKTGSAKSPHVHHDVRYSPKENANTQTVWGSRWGYAYDPQKFWKGDGTVIQVYKDLQTGLKAAGFYEGEVDGQWGPLSEDAYLRMCKAAATGGGNFPSMELVQVFGPKQEA